MKLTEAKLKQLIRESMQHSEYYTKLKTLQADIDLVIELSSEIDRLREKRFKISGDRRLVVVGRKRTPEIKEVDKELAAVELKISNIAKKYNIRHYYDSPGNYDLIKLMKKKFRRKSL